VIDFITSGDVAQLGERYVPQYTAPTQSPYTILGNTIYRSITGGQTFGGFYYTAYCRTSFETTPDGTIVEWRWEGNACRAK